MYNLSNVPLTEDQLDLLSRGLRFSVTSFKPDRFQLEADTNNFVRRLRLKGYFHGHTQNADKSLALFEHPSNLRRSTHRNWTPNSGRNINLDRYINVVKEAIIGESGHSKTYLNITNNEQKALKELISRAGRDSIILRADKGGVTCVLSREDYITKANQQLKDTNTYKHLKHDTTNHIKTTVQKLLIEMKKDNIRDNELFHNMFPSNIKPGRLYFLPKIHKTGNPGRLIT